MPDENPVLAAMEAYRRANPHRSDALDEAFEKYESEPDDDDVPTDEEEPEQMAIEAEE